MAKVLDSTPIKMGYLIPIQNTERKHGEAFLYYTVKLENQAGDNEFWCMFTEKELKRMVPIEMLSSKPKKSPGRLYYNHKLGKSWYSFTALYFPKDEGASKSDELRVVRIPETLIKHGRLRCNKNPEDQLKVSWVDDLMD